MAEASYNAAVNAVNKVDIAHVSEMGKRGILANLTIFFVSFCQVQVTETSSYISKGFGKLSLVASSVFTVFGWLANILTNKLR